MSIIRPTPLFTLLPNIKHKINYLLFKLTPENQQNLLKYHDMYNTNNLPQNIQIIKSQHTKMFCTIKKHTNPYFTKEALALLANEITNAYKTALPINSIHLSNINSPNPKFYNNCVNYDLYNYFLSGEILNTKNKQLEPDINIILGCNKYEQDYIYCEYKKPLYFATLTHNFNPVNIISNNLDYIFYLYSQNKNITH